MLLNEVSEMANQHQAVPAWITVSVRPREGTYSAYFGLVGELGNRRSVPMAPKACKDYLCLARDIVDPRVSLDLLNSPRGSEGILKREERSRPRAIARSTSLLNDDVVQVTRWDFEPGAETGWHRHGLDYVIVPMTACNFLLEEPEGERSAELPAGAVYRRSAGVEHNVVNGGKRSMSFIEIEIKRPARA
jgi:quercetin dioxygenase-like cupin family protein